MWYYRLKGQNELKDTPSLAEARLKKKQAKTLLKEAERLDKRGVRIQDRYIEISSRRDKAKSLLVLAQRLKKQARLENITVRKNPIVKTIKNGEKRIYYRWIASWREGKKTKVVYLGSVKKVSKDQALEKAKLIKAQYLEKQREPPSPRIRISSYYY
jgi:hypothetical protein